MLASAPAWLWGGFWEACGGAGCRSLRLEEGLRLAVALGDLSKATTEQEAQAARESLEAELARVTTAAPTVPLVSGAAGQLVEAAGALDVDHWLRDDTAQDGLSGCSKTLAGLGVGLLIEAGPGSTMARELAGGWPESAGKPPHCRRWPTPEPTTGL